MKKKVNKGCLIVILLATLIPLAVAIVCVGALIYLNKETDPLQYASSILEIEIPEEAVVIIDEYSEPSFPTGDGYSWIVVQIPSEKTDKFVKVLEISEGWQPLPLPDEYVENGHYLQPTIIFGLEGEIPISEATGYYIFIDEQEEYNKRHGRQTYDTSKPFYERSSFNYRFGLFDERDGTLYILSIDT